MDGLSVGSDFDPLYMGFQNVRCTKNDHSTDLTTVIVAENLLRDCDNGIVVREC